MSYQLPVTSCSLENPRNAQPLVLADRQPIIFPSGSTKTPGPQPQQSWPGLVVSPWLLLRPVPRLFLGKRLGSFLPECCGWALARIIGLGNYSHSQLAIPPPPRVRRDSLRVPRKSQDYPRQPKTQDFPPPLPPPPQFSSLPLPSSSRHAFSPSFVLLYSFLTLSLEVLLDTTLAKLIFIIGTECVPALLLN